MSYTKSVDLKWSLWSERKEYWEEFAPGAWDWMREWYEASTGDGKPESAGLSDSPRVIATAPRKEIRFGSVEFSPGFARVHFWSEFDDGSRNDVFGEVDCETFEDAMSAIDDLEEELIEGEL